MLEPNNRQLFLTALRPPEGYELDALTGTTFSLDLDALLSVPLSLTLFGADYQMDAAALMMAIRRYADIMSIYCQQGEMQSARQHSLLYSYLESVVVEVTPPTPNRVFHPKVWVLRYKHPAKPLLYRLLCMSRNLTYDRSWDTIVMLEGSAGEGVIAENQALVDFLNFLAQQPGSKPHTGKLAEEIRTVRFEPPAPFQHLKFYVLGLEANRDRFADIFQSWKRLLVISPFIEPNLLARLAQAGKNHVLVSRADELDCLVASQIMPYRNIFTLVDTASPETTDDDPNYLRGLHAKLYLADTGDRIHLWTGSANATNAAFNGNIEFLVELVKPRNSHDGFTIEKLIQPGSPNELNFRSLLAEYRPSTVPVEPDKAEQDLENLLEAAKATIIEAEFSAVYQLVSENLYHLKLYSNHPVHLGDVRPSWNPVTIQGNFTLDAMLPCSLEAITAFFAFSLSAETAGITRTIRFALKLPMSGTDLEARDRAIVQKIVGNRQGVLRYLLMLLGDLDNQQMNIFDNLERLLKNGAAGATEGIADGLPLFETMMRALVEQPDRLEEIERFIRDVDKTLLPDHFLAIWQPVWDTYVQSRTHS